jgi:hypothetical protein
VTDTPRVIHRSLPGISPEDARDARLRAWAYVFEVFNHPTKKRGQRRQPQEVCEQGKETGMT